MWERTWPHGSTPGHRRGRKQRTCDVTNIPTSSQTKKTNKLDWSEFSEARTGFLVSLTRISTENTAKKNFDFQVIQTEKSATVNSRFLEEQKKEEEETDKEQLPTFWEKKKNPLPFKSLRSPVATYYCRLILGYRRNSIRPPGLNHLSPVISTSTPTMLGGPQQVPSG